MFGEAGCRHGEISRTLTWKGCSTGKRHVLLFPPRLPVLRSSCGKVGASTPLLPSRAFPQEQAWMVTCSGLLSSQTLTCYISFYFALFCHTFPPCSFCEVYWLSHFFEELTSCRYCCRLCWRVTFPSWLQGSCTVSLVVLSLPLIYILYIERIFIFYILFPLQPCHWPCSKFYFRFVWGHVVWHVGTVIV